jgi:Domain of unknown function (DUF4263)
MKTLEKFRIRHDQCQRELIELKAMLDGSSALKERTDILPFFRTHQHLAALVGSYNPQINQFDRIATEFDLFGDFTCDLVVGDSKSHNFCFVEFEDAAANSIFVKKRSKATPEWSPRFEHGFSQILDWFSILEDQKRTVQFQSKFESLTIQYVGLLVIGRRHYLDESQYSRLRWRSDQVNVGNKKVYCLTFDELYQTLELKLNIFS